DSITTLSKNPEGAARWVKFLSGEQCQDIIANSGVVFPARPHATDLAVQYNTNVRHLDVTPFTNQVKNKTTFLFPVTSNADDITYLDGVRRRRVCRRIWGSRRSNANGPRDPSPLTAPSGSGGCSGVPPCSCPR